MATPHFPKKTLESMRKAGISESDVLDTVSSGEHSTASRGSRKAVKRNERG